MPIILRWCLMALGDGPSITSNIVRVVVLAMIIIASLSGFFWPKITTAAAGLNLGEEDVHERSLYPFTPEYGHIQFVVQHEIHNDFMGGDEIIIHMKLNNKMNETAIVQMQLKPLAHPGNDDWYPGRHEWRTLSPDELMKKTRNTDFGKEGRGLYDGGYNVTVFMSKSGSRERIGYINVSAERVPAPRGCWFCL